MKSMNSEMDSVVDTHQSSERAMSSKLEIEYPENLPDVLQTTRARFEQEVKMAMAVKLFEMRRLSSGMAAALVEMDRVSFLLRLIDRSDYSDL